MSVYLCGPISGQDSDYEWREYATRYLGERGIETKDPLRGKEKAKINGDGLYYDGELADTDYADRDAEDVRDAEVVLCCVDHLPETRPPWGTPWELGMATESGARLVICSAFPSIRDHLFTRGFADWIGDNLEEALAATVQLCGVRAIEEK